MVAPRGTSKWLTGWRAVETDVPYAEFAGELVWTVECDEGALLTADCPKDQREAVAKLAAVAPTALGLLVDLEQHCRDHARRDPKQLAAEGHELRSRVQAFLAEIGAVPDKAAQEATP